MSNESLKYLCSYAQYFFAALTALSAIGNIYYGRLLEHQKVRESANSGSLSNRSLESVSSLHASHSKESVYIKFGTMTMGFPYDDVEKGVSVNDVVSFNGGSIAPITLKIADDKLLITAKVFSLDGKLVGEIVDNEWFVNSNNYYKRNYDNNAVEIIDQYDNVVLSAEITHKNQIVILGIFVDPGRSVSFFNDEVSEVFGLSSEAIEALEKEYKKPWIQIYRDKAVKVKRRFKYGKGSLGKRITDSQR